MPGARGRLGTLAALPDLWPRRLLRFLTEPARHQALPRHRPSGHEVVRARRKLGLVLHRPGLRRAGRARSKVVANVATRPYDQQAYGNITLYAPTGYARYNGVQVELERRYKINIYALAYPNGDYSERDLRLAQQAGYRCALTQDPGFNDRTTDLFRLRRIPVQDESSISELLVKASGLWGLISSLWRKPQPKPTLTTQDLHQREAGSVVRA